MRGSMGMWVQHFRCLMHVSSRNKPALDMCSKHAPSVLGLLYVNSLGALRLISGGASCHNGCWWFAHKARPNALDRLEKLLLVLDLHATLKTEHHVYVEVMRMDNDKCCGGR